MKGKTVRATLLLAVSVSAWLAVAPAASAQLLSSPWPKFQSNSRNSGKTTVDGPSATAVRERWAAPYQATDWIKTQISTDGNGVIYFAHVRNVACAVSAADGSELWCSGLGGYANASSAALGNETTPGAGDYRIYRGERQNRFWSLETDGDPTEPYPRTGPGPTFTGWPYKIPLDGDVFSSANIGPDGTIYTACGCLSNGMVHAFRPDGTVKWTFRVGKGIRESSPALFVQQSRHDPSRNVTVVYIADVLGNLHAIEDHGPNDARLRFKVKVGAESRQASPSIRADGKVIYQGVKEGLGAVQDFDQATGQYGVLRWRVPTVARIDVAAAIDDATGKVYVSSHAAKVRTLYEITPAANNLSATAKILFRGAGTETNNYAQSPSAAIGANGLVYQAIGQTVMAFQPAGCASPCAPRWSYTLSGQVIAISLDAGALYASTKDSRVFALEDD